MKLPKLKKHDPVELWWLDIYDPKLPSWGSDDEIKDAIKSLRSEANSRGYFYCEEDGYLYFYGDQMDDKFSRLTGIPKGCIVRIEKHKKGKQ